MKQTKQVGPTLFEDDEQELRSRMWVAILEDDTLFGPVARQPGEEEEEDEEEDEDAEYQKEDHEKADDNEDDEEEVV